MNKLKALEITKEVSAILYALDIDHWVDAGTCLGFYREGDFIEHDNDVDFGILAEDCKDVGDLLSLFGAFLERGFRIYHTFGTIDKGFEIALWKDGIKVDLFWYYLVGDKRWHGAWRNGGRNGDDDLIKLVFDRKFFDIEDRREATKVLNHHFQLPLFTEEYLIARYGEDWRVPDKRWDWATSPKCINNDFEI